MEHNRNKWAINLIPTNKTVVFFYRPTQYKFALKRVLARLTRLMCDYSVCNPPHFKGQGFIYQVDSRLRRKGMGEGISHIPERKKKKVVEILSTH